MGVLDVIAEVEEERREGGGREGSAKGVESVEDAVEGPEVELVVREGGEVDRRGRGGGTVEGERVGGEEGGGRVVEGESVGVGGVAGERGEDRRVDKVRLRLIRQLNPLRSERLPLLHHLPSPSPTSWNGLLDPPRQLKLLLAVRLPNHRDLPLSSYEEERPFP